ncbi:MAG: ABC transporter ATP-binding protein [Microthrixaceae bacterium]|nr:ABC transporter ATP-binding protein [Microthrixaceae bacterium]TXI55276.1 MAG: ABC transporter ATP-binding protein [Mycobacterium sp.]
MSLFQVTNLEAGYGIVDVLFGLDFTVEAGEAVVILGANGSGKTTTLRAVSGMLAAKGSIHFAGSEVLGKRPDQLLSLGIAHVPQGRGTIVDLTVEENLRVGAYTRTDGNVEAEIARWYDVFPRLAERRTQLAGSMSGGEQQMLAIARAFVSNPKLVLLDEPSLGLAPLVTREVFERVGDLVRETGTAVLLVEQNANLALDFASRGYVLEAGRIVSAGSADELRADDSIRKAYLGG